ncbi:MAG: SIS domain-containing protein, partial [Desulfobacteraceae bacterium]|nr:SIS domain-containing protein [Desulfobacteraceae bacterium]
MMCNNYTPWVITCALLLIIGCDKGQEKKVDEKADQIESTSEKIAEAMEESVELSKNSSSYVVEQYWDITQKMIQEIMSREKENMEKASELMAESISKGRLIHVFGTGAHNIMAGMEIF